MSTQNKIERILKQIHILFSQGQTLPNDPEKVIIDKKEIFSILEELNLAMYEMMDEYEITSQARELAQRRHEKKGEELIQRVNKQAEDVYAASLLYTDEALSQLQRMMKVAVESNEKIWRQFSRELEKEKNRMREDQMELREQLQDFKDTNVYLTLIEERNRELEKQEKEPKAPEKKIQNEAKHYAMKGAPEIKVNPAYFKRRELEVAVEAPKMEEAPLSVTPEIKVDLDAEYFKRQKQDNEEQQETSQEKRDWKALFGKNK